MVVTLGQQYNIGEEPTVMLYTYIFNRHAGTPDKTKQRYCSVYVCVCVVIPFILDVRFVDVPAGVTQEEGHSSLSFYGACLNFSRREGFSRPFPSSTVRSHFFMY